MQPRSGLVCLSACLPAGVWGALEELLHGLVIDVVWRPAWHERRLQLLPELHGGLSLPCARQPREGPCSLPEGSGKGALIQLFKSNTDRPRRRRAPSGSYMLQEDGATRVTSAEMRDREMRI